MRDGVARKENCYITIKRWKCEGVEMEVCGKIDGDVREVRKKNEELNMEGCEMEVCRRRDGKL